MPVFAFRAWNDRGEAQSGTLTADTPAQGRQQLRDRGWRIEVFAPWTEAVLSRRHVVQRVARVGRRSRRMDRVAEFARQLALLIRSGEPLADALEVLIAQLGRGAWQAVVRDVRDQVVAGASLAEAMRRHPDWFDAVFLSAVRVGQQAGSLDTALTHLGAFLRERSQLGQRVTTALVYPLILVVMGTGVTIFLMTYVIPQLITVLQAGGRPLPAPTALLKTVSDALLAYWPWLAVGTVGLAAAISGWLRTTRGRRRWHALLLRIPLLGALLRKALVAHVAQQLAMLLSSGIPFAEAVATVQQGTRNAVLADELAAVEHAIVAGSDIGPSLSQSRVFPPLVVHLMAVGQNAGELPTMLEQIKDSYETEVSLALSRFTAALEPLLIVLMAGVIGFIIIATVMPILEATRGLQ